MVNRLVRECERLEPRARSLRIQDFRFTIAGLTITLEGDAASPEGVDSIGKVFATTSAREIRNLVRHVEVDPARPGSAMSPHGYVEVQQLGPNGSRLAETVMWLAAPGDTCESIAEAVYGDRALADRVRRANRHQLDGDGHLRTGMRLRVPPR